MGAEETGERQRERQKNRERWRDRESVHASLLLRRRKNLSQIPRGLLLAFHWTEPGHMVVLLQRRLRQHESGSDFFNLCDQRQVRGQRNGFRLLVKNVGSAQTVSVCSRNTLSTLGILNILLAESPIQKFANLWFSSLRTLLKQVRGRKQRASQVPGTPVMLLHITL